MQQKRENQFQETLKKLSSVDFRKYILKVAETLSNDECFPESFRQIFKQLNVTVKDSNALYNILQDPIRTFKETQCGKFLEDFIRLSTSETSPQLIPNKQAQNLLIHGLAVKCNNHLVHGGDPSKQGDNLEEFKPVLTEKELAALQYLSGHVAHKTFIQLRKSRHWREEKFQQCINFLRNLKIDPTEKHRFVRFVMAIDRGGLWFVCENIVNIFKQAEFAFSKVS